MPKSVPELKASILNKSATVGVIGLGYVGLPLIRAFVQAGYRTMGFDVDQTKVDRLLAGQSYIGHIPSRVDRRVHRRPSDSLRRPTCGGWPKPMPC